MSFRFSKYRQQCVRLWSYSGKDDHDQPTVSSPVTIKCRWVNTISNTRDSQGNLIQVDATAIVDQNIEVNSIMQLVCEDDQYSEGYMQVVSFNRTYDHKTRKSFRQVGLIRWKDTLPTVA